MIRELEKKMAGIDLDKAAKEESKKSTIQSDLESGTSKASGKERKVVKGARKTVEGRLRQVETEESRLHEEALIKATLKQHSGKVIEEDDDDDDGSIEGDYPHVKFDQLKDLEDQLAEMKIKGEEDDDEGFEDFEDDDEEDESITKSTGGKKEEAKQVKKK